MKRRPRRPDPHQLKIEWRGAPESTPPQSVPVQRNVEQLYAESVPLVQRLPWNFKNTFPQPLPEAIDAGVLDETDATPEGLRALHASYAETALATLRERDRLFDARRRGVDPMSGRPPTTAAARERLRKSLATAPQRQEDAFKVLMLSYGDAFGIDAADAFAKALSAWHANIDVVADDRNHEVAAEELAPESGDPECTSLQSTTRHRRRSPSSLPIPKPLSSAIRSGVFGHDERGPIRPTPAEVREITESHAAKLLEFHSRMSGADVTVHRHLREQFESGIARYAEDFGDHAAARLRTYVQRLALEQHQCGHKER